MNSFGINLGAGGVTFKFSFELAIGRDDWTVVLKKGEVVMITGSAAEEFWAKADDVTFSCGGSTFAGSDGVVSTFISGNSLI